MRLPDTPVGRQAAWFFHHSESNGRDLTVDEVAEHMRFPEPWTPERGLERFREPESAIQINGVEERSPYNLAVRLVYESDRDKPWVANFRVEEQPPHVITWLQFVRDVGAGVVIREATAADEPVLAELERRSPLTVGEVSITYDRGDDFFAFARLMEDNVNLVAEEDGEIVGLFSGCLHKVIVGGEEYQAMLMHHLRIPPEQQKKGLYSALNVSVFQAFEGRQNAPYAYTAMDNAAAIRLRGPDSWSFPAQRALLLCAGLAGGPAGAPATPDDGPRIIEILNRCHEGEEMYVPYTVESLAARLERAPDLYSWERVWLTDRAVVGVWPAGLRVVTEAGGYRAETVRATVLDYGFLPGAEGEFEQLLRAWCAWLASNGHSELGVLTSEGSPNYPVLGKLASQMDAYLFRMGAPEPEGAAQRGLYVDGIYF
ncbi:MAG: hypothetical protein WEE64_12545 [Dehalococcoidia bacterium]